MNIDQQNDALDKEVRFHIYDSFLSGGKVPLKADIAAGLGRTPDSITESLGRLAAGRVVVLQEEGGEILMANPFSAVPTPFIVEAGERSWWGNCIWDALGILAMVGQDGRIVTACGDCNDAMLLQVEGGKLLPAEGLIHFSVPAVRWWENIKFT